MKVIFSLALLLGLALPATADDVGRKNLNRGEARVVYSTNIDFDSTLIDGRMKAPTGFFLQGRNRQSLSNMVRLRSKFKTELRRSRTAVKAMVR